MKTFNRKAQLEVTFNWVYILIAGAIILLFFGGIIMRQSKVSEEQLGQNLVGIMDSIFSVAGTTENLRKTIDISGLSGYTLYFHCDEGVGEFGISGQSAAVTDSIMPLFAPSELEGNKLLLWSMPYKLPFKVIDFLMVTSEKTAYIVWGESDFSLEFLKTVEELKSDAAKDNKESQSLNFHIQKIDNFDSLSLGKVFQVRIVDINGKIKNNALLDLQLTEQTKFLGDDKVTAVSFVGDNMVNYFQREEGKWVLLNKKSPINIISLPGKKSAAKYAAVFAGNPETYQCNMLKALNRLKFLNELYGGAEVQSEKAGGKLGAIIDFYASSASSVGKECPNYLAEYDNNVQGALNSHQNAAKVCALQMQSNIFYPCTDLVSSAYNLQKANKALSEGGDCISLY